MSPLGSGGGGALTFGWNTTIPLPKRVNVGAEDARNSIGTKPPEVSRRRTTSVGPVACSMGPTVAAAVGATVGAGGDAEAGDDDSPGLREDGAVAALQAERPTTSAARMKAWPVVRPGGRLGMGARRRQPRNGSAVATRGPGETAVRRRTCRRLGLGRRIRS